jgi:DNA polymerase I-like protein with 3'-5' exonuclease and polymerase domains
MDILTLDFETHYSQAYSLSKMTTEEYVRDPRFEAIGISVQVNDEPPEWCSGGKLTIGAFLRQYDWDNCVAVAHNAMFDMAILSWRFGIRPKRIADTLSMARALLGTEVGGSLKVLVEHFGLGAKGDEVIHALGKRRIDFSPDELARYGDYCCNDTALTYKLFQRMCKGFPVDELRLIDLTIRMFTEPTLLIDSSLLTEHLRDVRDKKADLLNRALFDKDRLMSNDKLAELLREMGVEPPMKVSPRTGKDAFAFSKTDEEFKALLEHEDPLVQAVVAARLGVKSTLEETRTERFLQIAERGTLPVQLRYYAAHTGRWGGDGKLNLQNLPRGGKLKKSILAPDGYVIIDSDSSQIEARTLAWLAEQDDLVAAFDAGEDVYRIMASAIYGKDPDDISKDERFVGKTTILGCFGPDTLVLTNGGWKAIVEVQATDMVWDGEEWVAHQGVVPQGEKVVMEAWGVTATPDHEILTGHGWAALSAVHTNPSLTQSAFATARSKLPAGYGTHPRGVLSLDGTQQFAAPAGGRAASTGTTSKQAELLAATHAPRPRAQQPANGIGGTQIYSPTTTSGSDYSTALQAVSPAATQRLTKPSRITGGGASLCTSLGGQTEALSCDTSSLSITGTTPVEISTVSTTQKGTSPGTFGSQHDPRTHTTSAPSASYSEKSMTYDIAYSGPRNRYMIATAAGPLIVHNCGYGMGHKRFKLQLMAFGVVMPEEECARIISVYRETYPAIPLLWKQADKALRAITQDRLTGLGLDGVLQVEGDAGIRLPNGLYIRYPGLRWEEGEKDGFVYDFKRGRATFPKGVWGGAVVENVCQALARIVIGEQMIRVSKKYKPVITVHDAIGALAPKAEEKQALAYVEECMRTRPVWAPTLPLNCEAGSGASYGDC